MNLHANVDNFFNYQMLVFKKNYLFSIIRKK